MHLHYEQGFRWVNMVNQEKLIKEIKSLSDSIRSKNRALRLGISERDKFLESTFKPVIDPLKEVSQKLGKVSEGDLILPFLKSEYKTEQYDEGTEEELEETEDEPEEIQYEQGKHVSEEEEEDEEEEDMEEGAVSNISRLGLDIQSKGELGRKYVLKMLQSTIPNRNYHVYGARLEKDGLMIGDSKLDVDEQDNIIIGGKTYKGTNGLFELIFKSKPDKYTTRDLAAFKSICIKTNTHRKSYKSAFPIHRNASVKYKNIISELFPTKLEKTKKRFMPTEDLSTPFYTEKKKRKVSEESASGEGLLKNTYNTNIIYYNDVNKLVNRMRLIHEATEAGHTGLQNEWVALIGELLNRGIIER